MSDSDSFIEEVTEEVRRDRLFALMRKWGWIPVLAVILIVAGAGYREYSIAQDRAAAQALGSSILAALEGDEPDARIAELAKVETDSPGGQAVVAMLMAAEQASAEDEAAASQTLSAIAANPDLPEIYRQIATFKSLLRSSETMGLDERRLQFEVLATPGSPLRLLAEEQLALLDVEGGDTEAALTRLQRLIADSEVTPGLRRRASQLIVALGGELAPA